MKKPLSSRMSTKLQEKTHLRRKSLIVNHQVKCSSMEANPPKEETSQQINLIGVRVTLTFSMKTEHTYVFYILILYTYLERNSLEI